jgi:hypothetical protein
VGVISAVPLPNAQASAGIPVVWRGVAGALPGVQSALLTPFRFISEACVIVSAGGYFPQRAAFVPSFASKREAQRCCSDRELGSVLGSP